MRAMRGQIVDVRDKIGLPSLYVTATPLSCQGKTLNNATFGDDEAVRNGDDDGESGTNSELFRQLVAIPPKKCRRAACSSMSLSGCATSRLPEQNSEGVQRQPA